VRIVGLDVISLVGANTGGFEGFRAQLFVLIGDHVDAERELVDIGTLTTKIENANFGVGYTTVEPRLGVGLSFETNVSILIAIQ